MDLGYTEQHFLVCGASSGFGRAIAERLLDEGAHVLAVARRADLLDELADRWPKQAVPLSGDISTAKTRDRIVSYLARRPLHGVVFNAGGPPTGPVLDTTMEQWDDAYRLVVRWKIDLALRLTPQLIKSAYGRLLFIESQAVKQPIDNLVLSNALRLAIVGFAKTLAHEIADKGITVNVIAPGSHETKAIERVIHQYADTTGLAFDDAKEQMAAAIPVRRMGRAGELASLAAWVLSRQAGYVTGQTFSHDGGSIRSIFG